MFVQHGGTGANFESHVRAHRASALMTTAGRESHIDLSRGTHRSARCLRRPALNVRSDEHACKLVHTCGGHMCDTHLGTWVPPEVSRVRLVSLFGAYIMNREFESKTVYLVSRRVDRRSRRACLLAQDASRSDSSWPKNAQNRTPLPDARARAPPASSTRMQDRAT